MLRPRHVPFLIASILCCANSAGLGQEKKRADDPVAAWAPVEKLIRGHVDRKEIAGAVVLVARRGEPTYLKAFGMADAEAGSAMTTDTIFRIASMTKPITSVAAMMLVEEGKLRLDDPVSKFIPEFADMTVLLPAKGEGDKGYRLVQAEHALTIRHLLTHTSGISYRLLDRPHLAKLYAAAGVADGLAETPGTAGDNVRRLAAQPLLHQPGAAWEYGLNTDVLGRVIEVVSGKTLGDFIGERIVKPLGMQDTFFIVPKEKRGRLAALYTPGANKKIERVGKGPITSGAAVFSASYPVADDSRFESGGAGLVSTARDYARFLQLLLNRGELDRRRLLKPETVDQMTRNQVGNLQIAFAVHGDGFGYGFGVVTGREKPASPAPIGSYSWGGIFDTFFWVDPRDGLIGIVMTQLYPFGHLNLWHDFQSAVYQARRQGQPTSQTHFDKLREAAMNNGGDARRGQALFASAAAQCAVCHKVHSVGGDVGPDLSQIGGKFDRTHLIESILDPSAEILQGYQTTNIEVKSGRAFSGIVKSESAATITLVDAEGKSTIIATNDIESRFSSKVSLMPTGFAESMKPGEFTDLIAYLSTLHTGRQPTPGEGAAGTIELPAGFKAEVVLKGLTGATAMEVVPDGRILICEQTGALRVVKDDKLLPEPFVRLAVDSAWERGVIGVAIAPDFPKSHGVFINYVAARPYPHHVVSRFTAEGDTAVPGSERILLEGDDQRKLGGDVPAGHQGGALHFGKDGKLFVAIGDQTAGKPAQQLTTLQGKMLRINPDGTIPDDNPFASKTTGKYRAIWALGLRNPFTFAVQPETGRIFINDVGGKAEEINDGVAGANYGWPTVDHGPTTDPRFRGPIHHYPTACIIGGAFAPAGLPWPNQYRGKYFFGDFNHGAIRLIDPESPAQSARFATGTRRLVDLRFGADNNLYVLLRDAWVIDKSFQPGTGALVRIRPPAN